MYCIILSAGKNTRLNTGIPKSLLKVNGMTLLERHIKNFSDKGVRDFCVVTGHHPEPLHQKAPELAEKYNVIINLVHNHEYELENGYSLGVTREWVRQMGLGAFFLTMGDHYFQADLIDGFMGKLNGSKDPSSLFLAVDKPGGWNTHIDLEDVTKVLVGEDMLIREIGKAIRTYNFYDTGLFYMKKEVFEVLNQCFEQKKYTLSDMVITLAGTRKAKAIELSGYFWNDVDNPADLENTIAHIQVTLQ